jgi:hypothetical protein
MYGKKGNIEGISKQRTLMKVSFKVILTQRSQPQLMVNPPPPSPPPLEKCASSLFLSRLENDLRTCHLHDREHSRAGRPSEEDLNSQEVSPCGVHGK